MAGPEVPEPRSKGTLANKREPLPWPEDQEFRILSIDGGGIKGIFPAAFLSEMERRYLDGGSIARYFDLITGTSAGGIIALGLGAGFTAAEMLRFYMEDGREIFRPRGLLAPLWRARQLFVPAYDRAQFEDRLERVLGSLIMSDSQSRLCIPSCDGTHGDVWVYKTPHHPDYQMDGPERMVNVGLATSAAPTYFTPWEHGGYRLLDGGLWANNPTMVGAIEALTAFDVPQRDLRVLSLGCGIETFRVGSLRMRAGAVAWWKITAAAMSLQSQAVLGQAQLLLGQDRVMRIEPPQTDSPIRLDDYQRAAAELPACAATVASQLGEQVFANFFGRPARLYTPFVGGRPVPRDGPDPTTTTNGEAGE